MNRRLRAILAGLTVAAWAAAGGAAMAEAQESRAAAGPAFPPPSPGLFVPRPNPRASRASAEVFAPPVETAPAQAQTSAAVRLLPAPRPDRARPSPPDVFAPPANAAPDAARAGPPPPLARPSETPERPAAATARRPEAVSTPGEGREAPGSAARTSQGATGGRMDLDAVSLIGIFGDVNAPRALLRLPSGEIARVSQGQAIGGITVTRITSEGVAVRSSAGQRILRMP